MLIRQQAQKVIQKKHWQISIKKQSGKTPTSPAKKECVIFRNDENAFEWDSPMAKIRPDWLRNRKAEGNQWLCL